MYLSLAAIHKLEHPFLKEWIEYHLLVGVEHFYLGCNDESDVEALAVLQPYIDRNIVTHTHIPGWGRHFEHYQRVADMTSELSKWVGFIDIDEFILPINKATIPELLVNYEDYGGLAICWRHYGSKLETNPKSQINELLYRKEADGHIKSILQPNTIASFPLSHHCTFKPGYFSVNEKFERVDGPFCRPPVENEIVLNHYFCRSRDYYYNVKMKRGRSDFNYYYGYEEEFWFDINKDSTVFDDLIARKYGEEINKRLV